MKGGSKVVQEFLLLVLLFAIGDVDVSTTALKSTYYFSPVGIFTLRNPMLFAHDGKTVVNWNNVLLIYRRRLCRDGATTSSHNFSHPCESSGASKK